MMLYKSEITEAEKADIDAAALIQEGRDAKYRAEEECRAMRRSGQPIEFIIGSVYSMAFWHHDAMGFWVRCPAGKLEDGWYRIYFHAWSDVLQECVLVVMVEGDFKATQRVSR